MSAMMMSLGVNSQASQRARSIGGLVLEDFLEREGR